MIVSVISTKEDSVQPCVSVIGEDALRQESVAFVGSIKIASTGCAVCEEIVIYNRFTVSSFTYFTNFEYGVVASTLNGIVEDN